MAIVMAEEDVKLITVGLSPYGLRVEIALKLKGIAYEKVLQEIYGENKSKLLLESNPVYKKIPVLIHNGKPVPESAIIVQYIDYAWSDKSPLFPKDPYAKAQQLFWADFGDKKIIDCFLRCVRCKEDKIGQLAVEFQENYKFLEEALSKVDGPFFGGDDLLYTDVLLAPWILYITAFSSVTGALFIKPQAEEFPCLHKMFESAFQHPVLEAVLPALGEVEEFIKSRLPLWRGTV